MKGLGVDFVLYLKRRCRHPTVDIHVETSFSRFYPFWQYFVSLVSRIIEARISRKIARFHDRLLRYVPTVAIVPQTHIYVVYVQGMDRLENVFLGFNAAYVLSREKHHYYAVPYVHPQDVATLAKLGFNPSILLDTLYYLPILAAISVTDLVEYAKFVRDKYMIVAQKLFQSRDRAACLQGYIVYRLLTRSYASFSDAYSEIEGIALRFLERSRIPVARRCIEVPCCGRYLRLFVYYLFGFSS